MIVISIRRSPAGDYGFRTRGDTNEVPDDAIVRPEQIRGAVWYSIPYLGYVNNWLSGQRRAFVVALVVAVLIGYALYNIGAETRERIRTRRTGHGREPDTGERNPCEADRDREIRR